MLFANTRTMPTVLKQAIAALAALAGSATALHASCVVTPFEVLDHSRTTGVPYASPADSGGTPARIRMLVYSNGRASSVRPRYAELINAVVPGVNATENLVSRLRFYGATVDSVATAAALNTGSQCSMAAVPVRPTRGIVIIAGTFPAVMYEGAAAQLAERNIATVVTTGGEAAIRLALNQFASMGWPVHNIALVGHGANGPAVNLVAMSSSSVRGVVSLDGFEALNRVRHPGLTGDPAWRPGNLRAPILHFRPRAHPDEDTLHFSLAARTEVVQMTMMEVEGKQSMTAPEAMLPPPPLQSLLGRSDTTAHTAATNATVAFLDNVLSGRPLDVVAIRRGVPAAFTVTHRPALASPAIQTDGRLNEQVWQAARTLPDATTIQVQIADDCDWMYVAIRPRKQSPFITELFIRPVSATALQLTTSDLLLHASASLCWTYGKAEVASADCNKSEAWWGASRTNQAIDSGIGEYAIAKRAIGIARCGAISGVSIGALIGGWGPNELYPAGADKNRPDTWKRIQ